MSNPGEKKDSELANAGPLVGGETVAILQNGQNLNTTPEEIAARYVNKAGNYLLAKIENLNLKTPSDTVLQWLDGFDATNSLPFKAVVIPKGGAFNDPGSNPDTATCTLAGTSSYPGSGQTVVINLSGVGEIASFVSGNYSGVSDFILNGVVPALQGAGYIVYSDNYPPLQIVAPIEGAAFNGKTINITVPPSTTNYGTSSAFSGGADAVPFADILLKYCDDAINIAGYPLKDFVSFLTTGLNRGYGTLSNVTTNRPLFKIIGDWIASISVPLADDYFVDIYIYGDKLPPIVPLP